MRPRRLLLAMGMCVFAPSTAHAARTEVIASAGIVSPGSSIYRDTTENLGYNRRNFRLAYVVEAGALRSLTYWLSVGPLLRFDYASLGAPYDGLPSIGVHAVSVAARVEADLFPWPRLFLWADPSFGNGWIGVPDARTSMLFWGVRGGVGIGTSRDKTSVRFRIGYAYAPTFDKVTEWTGTYNYGGWVFQLDGVLRVLP